MEQEIYRSNFFEIPIKILNRSPIVGECFFLDFEATVFGTSFLSLFFYKKKWTENPNYHGLGFGGKSGVLTTPLPNLLAMLLSISKLLMDSLLGDRVFVSFPCDGGSKRL